MSDIELLAKLQHFGAATGLLDFTWNPLVALWFACDDITVDGKLYVVNTNDPLAVSRLPTDEAAQNIVDVFSNSAGAQGLFYWEPAATGDASARILGQRSVFIIGRPLISVDAETTKEILIAKDDKEPLQMELQTLDVHQEALFQDIFGFAQASKRRPVPQFTSGAYVRRGNQHYQREEYDQAINSYSESIKLAPDAGLVYLLRGNAHAALEHHEEALDDYDQAVGRIVQIPSTARDALYFNRGNSKAALEYYEDALRDYTEALNLNPDLPQYFFNRGNIYCDLYRFEEALLDYDRISGREFAIAMFNKGNALLALGRLTEARKCYQEAATKDAHREAIRQNFGTLEQIMSIVEGWEYTVHATPDPTAGTMCLRLGVPEELKEGGRELSRFLLYGRAGNIGNTGGPGLSGGTGFSGKPFMRIYVDILD